MLNPSSQQFAYEIEAFEAAAQESSSAVVWASPPGTPIAYISITTSPSHYSAVEKVKDANRQIEAYVAGAKYCASI